ncbi:MAG: hypothetical protein ACI8Y4_002873 [Candidatus Poriferisodalaceae bacterium]|jgi:hypothetical protein
MYRSAASPDQIVARWTIDSGAVETVVSLDSEFWKPTLTSISADGRYVLFIQPTSQTQGALLRHDMVTGASLPSGFGHGEPEE